MTRQNDDTPNQEASNMTHDDNLPWLENGVSEPSGKQKQFKFNRKLLLIPLVFLIFPIGAFVGLYFQPPGLQFFMETTGLKPGGGTKHPIALPEQLSDQAIEQPEVETVTALGTLLPLQDVSVLAPPFGSNDARIAQLLVQEGERVAAGQMIAVMDNLNKLEADVQSAQAQVQVSEAQLAQIKTSIANSRLKAIAEVERIEANYLQAKNDLSRGQELKKSGVITQSELDRLTALEESTSRSLDSAKANLANYQYSNIDNQTDVKLASSNLFAANAQLKAKQQDMESASLRAPSDGVILTIYSRVGERPSSLGIASFGDTSKMQAKLEVYQSDVQHLQLGAPVYLRADALGKEQLNGTIIRIGLEVKKQQLIAASPAANTDARVVIVNVELSPESSEQAASLNGLEVTATIRGLRQ
jgi:HlyD family secretion protein